MLPSFASFTIAVIVPEAFDANKAVIVIAIAAAIEGENCGARGDENNHIVAT